MRLTAYYRREHLDGLVVIASPEDVDGLIDDLIKGAPDHNSAQLHSLDRPLLPSGCPDHEVTVGVCPGRDVGLIAYMDGDVGNIFTAGWSRGDLEGRYFIAGHPMEYPEVCEIPIALLRDALKEFLLTGGKVPRCVEWKTSEFW